MAALMSEDIISANEDTALSKLANILEKHRIKRVPILTIALTSICIAMSRSSISATRTTKQKAKLPKRKT